MSVQGQLDFGSTCNEVLSTIHKQYPLDLWMITRTNGQDTIVLQTKGKGFNIKPGVNLHWEDTLCVRLVNQSAPNIAPCIDDVPCYQEAPVTQNFNLKACMLASYNANGQLFGTICGVNTTTLDPSVSEGKPLLLALAQQLSKALTHDLSQLESMRANERLASKTYIDDITLLTDWRGWDALLDAENVRCKIYGNKGIVISMDMANLKAVNQARGREAGDHVLRKAAQLVQALLRPQDIIARVGNDEFGILCIDHPLYDAPSLAHLIYTTLMQEHINCYVGHASSLPHKGLRDVWELAEHMMYKNKKLIQFKN